MMMLGTTVVTVLLRLLLLLLNEGETDERKTLRRAQCPNA